MNGSRTQIVGLIGDPVEHSLSPLMQNEAFRHLGLDWAYLPFHVPAERLKEGVLGLRALGMRGANVTIPHKEKVATLVDELDTESEVAGAVNTIHVKGGKLLGRNTDIEGFLTSLGEVSPGLVLDKAAIFGAGGSASAVAVALASRGVERLSIVNRTATRAEALAERIAKRYGTDVRVFGSANEALSELSACSLLVKAVPSDLALPREAYGKAVLAYDLVYYGQVSSFLAQAGKLDVCTANGLTMLLHQGAASFRIWTGVQAPLEVMRRTIQR